MQLKADYSTKTYSSDPSLFHDRSYHSSLSTVTDKSVSHETPSVKFLSVVGYVKKKKPKVNEGVRRKGYSEIINPFMETEKSDGSEGFEELMVKEGQVKLERRPEYVKNRKKYVGSPDPVLAKLVTRRRKTHDDFEEKGIGFAIKNKFLSGKLNIDTK